MQRERSRHRVRTRTSSSDCPRGSPEDKRSAFKQPASALRRLSECTIDEYQLSGMEQPVRTLTRFTAGQILAGSLVGHDRFDQEVVDVFVSVLDPVGRFAFGGYAVSSRVLGGYTLSTMIFFEPASNLILYDSSLSLRGSPSLVHSSTVEK